MRKLPILLLLLLSGCGEDRKDYGFDFLMHCQGERHASYITGADGRIKSIFPDLGLVRMFIPYGGGMRIDGEFSPMPSNPDCVVLKFAPAIWVNGFPPKEITHADAAR